PVPCSVGPPVLSYFPTRCSSDLAEVVVASVCGGVRRHQDAPAAVEAAGVLGEVIGVVVEQVEQTVHQLGCTGGVQRRHRGGQISVEGVTRAPRRVVGTAPHALEGGWEFSTAGDDGVSTRVDQAGDQLGAGPSAEELLVPSCAGTGCAEP